MGSEMICLARTMRTQVICIHTVICEHRRNDDGILSKKEWFKGLLADRSSGWPDEIAEVFAEIDKTRGMVEKMVELNGKNMHKLTRTGRRESRTTNRRETGQTRLHGISRAISRALRGSPGCKSGE